MDLVQLQHYLNIALTWIGFGTVIGLAVKVVMPGRDQGGSVATLLMGIAGTLLGCAILQFFNRGQTILPVSVEGFFMGTAGALVLLTFYRVMDGLHQDEDHASWFRHSPRRRRRRRYHSVIED